MTESMTYELFCKKFDTEDACINALHFSRWPEGFHCPRCSHRHYYLIRSRKLPLYECSSCHVQTSLIAGTIMENSRTPLKLWFQALFLHSEPQGISATRLASLIGTTYKTAWLICHKIRHAMSLVESNQLLAGLVRVNWGVYGRPYNPTTFRHPQEQPLLAGATIDDNDQITHLKIKQVSDTHLIYDRITPSGRHAFIAKNVKPSVTDITVVIQKFSRYRYSPLIQICNYASQWINYTFNGIGPKHLQSYLDQYCFGYNLTKRNESIFDILLVRCALTPTLTYPVLIKRENNSEQHKRSYIELLKQVS